MNRPLRIAMFVGCFPVVSETFIIRQIVGLLELGHEVDIYADTRPEANGATHPEVARHRLLDRVTYMEMPAESAPWELPAWPITQRTWPPGSPRSIHNSRRWARVASRLLRCLARHPALTWRALNPSEYSYRAASLSSVYRLARLSARRGEYDVLHAHFGPVGNSFRFTRALWRAPLVVSFHGYDFSTVPRKEGRAVYRKLFETADLFTVNSSYTRARLESLGCPASRIRELPVGLRLDDFPFRERVLPRDGSVRVLSVGRLVEIKGHEFLLRAIHSLRREQIPVRAEIVGDGPLRARLETLIGELGLADAVKLHGALDSTAVSGLMDQAHLFVLPSVSVEGDQEGQGLALQEAQASGLPVIATRHGALPEGMVPEQSGFLVPERDADALAERLRFLIEHSDAWPAMGRCGRRFVETKYELGALSRRLVDLYRQLREGNTTSRPAAEHSIKAA
jgi:colanic acid/amylovoran biosynthesis glycosyltransferase